MKARSLISCILLSFFIILLLSMGVQATEYKEVYTEVNASNITEHIENGEDVNLTDCRIVGELNVSKINLETVPNPNFDKLLKEGYTRTEITNYYGLKENLSVIKSNIVITNSIFEKDLDFSNVLFNNSVDFTGATFNNSAYFCSAIFNNSADFAWTNFYSSADFAGTNFYDSADFAWTNFYDSADFAWANFYDSTNFTGPDTSATIITSSVSTCETFRNYYKSKSRLVDASNIYFNYRNECLAGKEWYDISKWWDLFYGVTCGYGTRPLYILRCVVIFIILFAYVYRPRTTVSVIKSQNKGELVQVYWMESGVYKLSDAGEKKSILSFLDALDFSINTFTGFGSTHCYPRENFRKWVTIEGLLGWITLAVFISMLTGYIIKL